MTRRLVLSPLLWGVASLGCLPDEAREPPAEILVTVEPSPATHDGFVTTTGWTVTFDQVYLNIGRIGFADDDDCAYYSFTQYSWLMELTEAGVEKAGLVYALGSCGLRFDLPTVDPDFARLGVGVEDDIRDFMAFQHSVVVYGLATREDEQITFDISLPYVSLGPCFESFDLAAVASADLASGERYELPLLVSPEALLSPITTPGTSDLDFGEADVDGNGYVSEFELYDALGAQGAVATEVGGVAYNLIGNFVRLRDGGPCLEADPEDLGFSPF